jgi:L-malate glycosyltransferase
MSGLSPHAKSPIEVLHIASGDRWAGAEVQLWTLVRHLNRREDTRARVVLLNEGETAERLREAGVAVDILDESRLNGFQILLGLRRLIRRHRPDIIHTHGRKENVLGSLANATTLRVPSVRTVHGAPEHAPPWSRPHKHLFRWLDWATGRYLQDRIIAVSHGLGEQLRRALPSNKVAVIENGVDIDTVRAHATTAADFRLAQPAHKHIGIVGRLDPVKRVDIFLEMAADLLKRELPWRLAFHVFGNGPLRADLESIARHHQIDRMVTFHGHRTDVHTCISSLDVLIMCSDHEGMPMTILEALALGTPVIAHRIGGLLDVLCFAPQELLLDDQGPRAYADAVVNLLSSPQLTAELRDRGRQELEQRFHAALNAANMADCYAELLIRQNADARVI